MLSASASTLCFVKVNKGVTEMHLGAALVKEFCVLSTLDIGGKKNAMMNKAVHKSVIHVLCININEDRDGLAFQ